MTHYYATGHPLNFRIDIATKNKLITLIAHGHISIAEAAEIAGVTYASVNQWLRRRKIDARLARQRYVKSLLGRMP